MTNNTTADTTASGAGEIERWSPARIFAEEASVLGTDAMGRDPNGDYVEFEDYDTLRAQLEAAEAGNHRANETQPTWAELTAHWKARAEAAEAEAVNLRAGNIAYSQQVNELIGRAGKAEADAKEKFQQYVDANEARIDLERLIVPGLRVYKGDHVVQIDAGKVGLFTERYSGDEDLPRAVSVLQDRAIDAARTKEAAP